MGIDEDPWKNVDGGFENPNKQSQDLVFMGGLAAKAQLEREGCLERVRKGNAWRVDPALSPPSVPAQAPIRWLGHQSSYQRSIKKIDGNANRAHPPI